MRYLILGATGTLGRATIKELLAMPGTEAITCLSRDELKQFEMKRELGDMRLSFVLGDIRDKSGIEPHFESIDVVFHFAALKRIPEMEAQPLESLKTNVHGTINAAECARAAGVGYFIFSSTDKACLPINTYGACKFLSEQLVFSMQKNSRTVFSVYRWGNVTGSRGSVIPQFRQSIEERGTVSVTDRHMTRFWIKIEDAVKFMLSTYKTKQGTPKIPKMKAANIVDVAHAVAKSVGAVDMRTDVIGLRPGEKLHEDIEYLRDVCEVISSETVEQYSPSELLQLVKDAP